MDNNTNNEEKFFHSKYDLIIRKSFDIKLKTGHEMSKAIINESNHSRTVHFLKGTRVYSIDIDSKQLNEMEFTKNHDVIHLSTNANSTYFLCVFRNGKLFAIDYQSKSVIYFKNLSFVDIINEEFNLNANDALDKIVVFSKKNIIIWYLNQSMNNQGPKHITEYLGYLISIQLEEERKTLIDENLKEEDYNEKTACAFNNNYFYGSFMKIFYLIVHRDIKKDDCIKIILVSYLFMFEKENNFSLNDKYKHKERTQVSSNNKDKDINNQLEYKKRLDSRYIYSYMINIKEPQNDVPLSKDAIIIKPSINGNIIAIALNFMNENNTTLMLFMSEIYKFNAFRLCSLFPNKPWKLWVEGLEWICNDTFIIVMFSYGYYAILNLNFQVILYNDSSNSITQMANTDLIHIPTIFSKPKLQFNDKLSIISSQSSHQLNSKINDSFIFYSGNIIIGFQCTNKDYHNHQLGKEISTFDDYIYSLKYYQLKISSNIEQLSYFDKIHAFTLIHFNDAFNRDNDLMIPSENVNSIFKSFAKFMQMFRAFNYQHETSLSLLCYLIGISNDFFFYLIKSKEVWLAFLFIELSEKYLLKYLRLKTFKSKVDDLQMVNGQTSYFIFNPFYISNLSLKCYNKIVNYSFYSQLRLILMFYTLIEYRNSQALNINVLYFVLGKCSLLKLMKHKLLDDINFILKVIIRNWKYLKSENQKAGGEEYVLNGLTLSYKTEMLSQYICYKASRNDIKFDFFAEFYSIDELSTFTNINQLYCEGDDERIINEFNYISHIGTIQKWTVFFVNNLYSDLFEDFKEYLNTHLKQTVEYIHQKKKENISPEEIQLSRLIYFNLLFFLLEIDDYIRQILMFFTQDCNNNVNEGKGKGNVLYDCNKVNFSFVSPLDVPFLIFEYSATEYSRQNESFHYEITENLILIIEKYRKEYSLTINEALFFIEYINSNGFKLYSEISYISTISPIVNDPMIIGNNSSIIGSPKQNAYNNFDYQQQHSKEQFYIYTLLIFNLINIHKTNTLFLLQTHEKMYFQSLDYLNPLFQKEYYELILLILNGYIRYFINKSLNKKIKTNESQLLNISLTLITKFFNRYIKTPFIRKNISDFIAITPLIIKPQFLYMAIQAEYQTLKSIAKQDILNMNPLLNIAYLNKNLPIKNLFATICENQSSNTIFELLFPTVDKNSIKNIFSSLSALLFNYNRNNEPLFTFVIDIKKIISEIHLLSNEPAKLFNKILKGNIDNFKQHNDLSPTLFISMKEIIIKIINLINILYIKSKILSMNPNQNILYYLKLFTYCIIFERNNSTFIKYIDMIIHTLKSLNLSQMKTDIDQKKVIEILQMINYAFIAQEIEPHDAFIQFELWLKENNQEYYETYVNIIQAKLACFKLKTVPQLKLIKSKMLRKIMICLNIDGYCKMITIVINQMSAYAYSLSDTNKNIPFQYVREKYVVLCENYFLMTGIASNSRFDFDSSFELIQNDELFQMIITDNNKGNKYYDKEHASISLAYCELLAKEKNNELVMPYLLKRIIKAKVDNESQEKTEQSNTTIVINSSTIRDDKDCNTLSHNKNKLRIALYQNSPRTNRSVIQYNPMKSSIRKMIAIIKKIFYYRFANNIFQLYKIQIIRRELEEIKIVSINIPNNTYHITTLKEKYLSMKDMEISQREDYNSITTLKPFDLINVNKYQIGKSDNSNIYKDLLKEKKKRNLNKVMKSKVDDLVEKISRYEVLIKTLDKEFSSSYK